MPAPARVSDADFDDAIGRYLSDGRLAEVALSINIGVPRLKREMTARGVAWKSPADTLADRQERMRTDPEWQRKLAEGRQRTALAWGRSPANRERMRELGRSRKGERRAVTPAERLDARSVTHQLGLLKVSPCALRLRDWIVERGAAAVLEQACGRYNIDIAVGPVAVEVHRYGFNPLGTSRSASRERQRTRYLTDRGWLVCYVWIGMRGQWLAPDAADYVVALAKLAERDPTTIGQYRVIRGTGDLVAMGRGDGDELS